MTFWRATLCLLLLPSLAIAQGQDQPTTVAGTPFEQREIRDSLDRKITYYIARPKQARAPILLMLQGSGCAPIFNVQAGAGFSTLFNLVPFAREGDFTVVAVEKPFADPAGFKAGGTASTCSADFNQDFTAERWLVAIRAALEDARKSPWVDSSRTLAFGFSEGAVMADLLAGHDEEVTDVVAIGGSGATQLFDFVALAYRRCFDASTCIAEIDRNLAAVQADPQSSTKMAWGHPHRRWTSFFGVDPGAELLRSKARVYIAFGTADESVSPLSEEVAIARLKVAGRDVTVRRVPNAGHSLSEGANRDFSDLDREYRSALAWFWQRDGKAQ